MVDLSNFFPKEYCIIQHAEDAKGHVFHLLSMSEAGICPVCGMESSRTHGYQERTARDLSILGKAVTLAIKRKKYFCDNNRCEADIFAEQSDFIDYYSQFTARCKEYMLKVATHVSCEAAVKILAYQGIRVCGDTLLNMLKKAGAAYQSKVGKKIGVDDWAYRRGKCYGTIICDLDTHEVIEILEGRDGKALEEWLKGYPDIEIVSRDRASAYSSVVSKVLPKAIQIADRFHITKNLLEALNDVMKGFFPEIIPVPDESSNVEVAMEAGPGETKTREGLMAEMRMAVTTSIQPDVVKKTGSGKNWRKAKQTVKVKSNLSTI